MRSDGVPLIPAWDIVPSSSVSKHLHHPSLLPYTSQTEQLCTDVQVVHCIKQTERSMWVAVGTRAVPAGPPLHTVTCTHCLEALSHPDSS